MNHEPDLEGRVRTAYRAATLPAAPDRLHAILEDMPPADLGRGTKDVRRWAFVGLVAAVGIVGVASMAALIVSREPQPASFAPASASSSHLSPTPGSTAPPSDPPGTLTVSQVLAARADGGLRSVPVVLKGYWTDRSFGHSCAAPGGKLGEIEVYCHDGEWGITELNEPIFTLFPGGRGGPPSGPHLTPYVPDEFGEQLLALRYVETTGDDTHVVPYAPVPIIVKGHFDDPRAAGCQPQSRQACLDRFVIDEIISFDPDSVPRPTPTPVPTPFPFDNPPPPKFTADMCQGGVPYSFVGWTTMADLGIDIGGEGHIYAMVTRDVVALSGWVDDPSGSGHRFRAFGRQVCYAWEWDEGAMGFTTLPGSGYRDWNDGRRELVDP